MALNSSVTKSDTTASISSSGRNYTTNLRQRAQRAVATDEGRLCHPVAGRLRRVSQRGSVAADQSL